MIVVLLTLAAVIIIMAYMFYRVADTDSTDKRHVVTVSYTYDVPTKRLSFAASAKAPQKIREVSLEAASMAAPMWQEQHDALQKELVETLLKNISGNSRSKPENHADDNI